ncbi:MAG: hypothetical protein ABSG75_05205 [Syntrophales bacterium]
MDEFLKKVNQGVYDGVGISVSHHNMACDLEMLWKFRSAARNSNKRVLFFAGGSEATQNSKQWLLSGVDLVFLGYAEKTFHRICERFKNNANAAVHELAGNIPGVSYLDPHGTHIYKPQEIMTDDVFRELFFTQLLTMDLPYKDYWDVLRQEGGRLNFNDNVFIPETVRLYTSSHCSRNCGFCSSAPFLKNAQRKPSRVLMLSAQDVMSLITHYVYHYGARGFLFADDDLFVGSKKGVQRIMDLCKLITAAKKNGVLPENLVFNCQGHVHDFIVSDENRNKRINVELINALDEAGFYGLGLGAETFSNKLLHSPSIRKLDITEEDSRMVIRALGQTKHLNPTINIIVMIPESTTDDILYSMKTATQYVLEGYQVAATSLMMSFPGAPLYERPEYRKTVVTWKNMYGGPDVDFSQFYIPLDRRCAETLPFLRASIATEIEKVKREAQWEGNSVPKAISSLCIFAATMSALGQENNANDFREVIHTLLKKEKVVP